MNALQRWTHENYVTENHAPKMIPPRAQTRHDELETDAAACSKKCNLSDKAILRIIQADKAIIMVQLPMPASAAQKSADKQEQGQKQTCIHNQSS
jgi:hypothetical protein